MGTHKAKFILFAELKMFFLFSTALAIIHSEVCKDMPSPACPNTESDVVCYDSIGVCVEACETVKADSDAICKEYGPNCKLNALGNRCVFADVCAEVPPPAYPFTRLLCAPNMAQGVDCRVFENSDELCAEDYVFADECWDKPQDSDCPPTDTGVSCEDNGDFTCKETCSTRLVGVTVTEDAVCRSFGPNCKLNDTGTHCQLADTCSDILPPDCAVVGDYCAPNLVRRQDCYVTANPNGAGFVCSNINPSV